LWVCRLRVIRDHYNHTERLFYHWQVSLGVVETMKLRESFDDETCLESLGSGL
jgi:hypothetical protein